MRWLSLPLRFVMLFALLAVMLIHPIHMTASGTIRHVTTDGDTTGDCGTWNAPCTLQYALFVAQEGNEIWVKAGTYEPSASGNREESIALKDGVAVYGGFTGNELNRDDRQWRMHTTILSGDLIGNDSGSARWDNPTFSDNSYHVVTAVAVSNSTILDGFTIRGGNADGGSLGDFPLSGGGLSMVSSSPILSNLIIAGNTSSDESLNGGGGGLFLRDLNCKPWLTNILFSGNQAKFQGGAINNSGGSPILTNVTFTGNLAGNRGGAISTRAGSMSIRNSIFWGNSAPNQTIMIAITTLTLTNSDIEGGCPSGGPAWTCNSTDRFDDPLFINAPGSDGIYGTADDNPRLQGDSPLIDQGSNSVTNPSLPITDLDGRLRIVGDIVDMGAFEQQLSLFLPLVVR